MALYLIYPALTNFRKSAITNELVENIKLRADKIGSNKDQATIGRNVADDLHHTKLSLHCFNFLYVFHSMKTTLEAALCREVHELLVFNRFSVCLSISLFNLSSIGAI